jgi:hypothetical protein
VRHCSSCNLEYHFEKFCTNCAHELEQGRLPSAIEKGKILHVCIQRGRVFRINERFCGGCGLPYVKATAGIFRFYVVEDVAEEDVLDLDRSPDGSLTTSYPDLRDNQGLQIQFC